MKIDVLNNKGFFLFAFPAKLSTLRKIKIQIYLPLRNQTPASNVRGRGATTLQRMALCVLCLFYHIIGQLCSQIGKKLEMEKPRILIVKLTNT